MKTIILNHLNSGEEVPMKRVLQPSSQRNSFTPEFIEAVKPLIFFLKKNRFHPHTKVIVEDTGAELLQGEMSTGSAFDGSLPESGSVTGAANEQALEPTEEVRKFVYLIEDTHPNRQGLWWGLEEVPLTSWETTFKAWTNDPLKAIQFDTFEQADEQRKKLNMDGYIVTEHEFVEMPPHEKVDSKPSLEP